jgi:uncharacterized damage-inducible protein DinB
MSVDPAYVQMMAAYNAEMNRRLYDAAARLPDAARRQDRGAFWGCIHGTLAHLVWGDRQWMSRFDGWEKNSVPLGQSAGAVASFEALRAERVAMDERIEAWADRVEQGWLDGELVWFSGAAGREVRKPLAVLMPHFFNHQTHHRGQAHAMITAAGEQTGDTDLFLLV